MNGYFENPIRMRSIEKLWSEGDMRILRQAVEKLKEHERTVIKLRYWEDLSSLEVAARLRRDWLVVKTRISAAQDKLKIICLSHPRFNPRYSTRQIFDGNPKRQNRIFSGRII